MSAEACGKCLRTGIAHAANVLQKVALVLADGTVELLSSNEDDLWEETAEDSDFVGPDGPLLKAVASGFQLPGSTSAALSNTHRPRPELSSNACDVRGVAESTRMRPCRSCRPRPGHCLARE